MNRGKTANMFDDDFDTEIAEFFEEVKENREDEELREAFAKFVNNLKNSYA